MNEPQDLGLCFKQFEFLLNGNLWHGRLDGFSLKFILECQEFDITLKENEDGSICGNIKAPLQTFGSKSC